MYCVNMQIKFIIFLICLQEIYSFKFSTKKFYLISDPSDQKDSYFGFSLLLRYSMNQVDPSIIIGAPKSNSTYTNHKGLNEPGAVYQCLLKSINSPKADCRLLLIDPTGNTKGSHNSYEYEHEKSNAWLGAAIDGDDFTEGFLIVCGPRWKNQIYGNFILPIGICYYITNTIQMSFIPNIFIPLVDSDKQVYSNLNSNVPYYAFGEAGFSIHLIQNQSSKLSKRILLGAVGVYNFRGVVIQQNYELNQKKFINSKPSMLITNPMNITKLTDNSYMGYSLDSGIFLRNSTDSWIVSGAPRGASLKGQVFLMKYTEEKKLKVFLVIEGEQIGAYFGAALCVVDINFDGISDLIVGAPMYTSNKSDEGIVYVYFGDGQGNFIQKNKIFIENIGKNSRFGHAIANLGDINNDNYADIIISAPYEYDGTGSIYVFLGSENGLEHKFIQRIQALDLSPDLKAFGSSFSRSLDIDKNQCNDIAVGAYKSGHVVVLLSQPAVTINATMHTNVKKITLNMTEMPLRLCFSYNGTNVPNLLLITIHIEVDTKYQRADIFRNQFVLNGNADFNKTLTIQALECESIRINFKTNLQQNGRPFNISMSYSICETEKDQFKNPVLTPWSSSNLSLSIPLEAEINLQVIRQSIPNQIVHILETENDIDNKRLEHNYNILNLGPSSLEQLQLNFYIPTIKIFYNRKKKLDLIELDTSELYFNDVSIRCEIDREGPKNWLTSKQFDTQTGINFKKTEFINCSHDNSVRCEKLQCVVPNVKVNITPIIIKLKLNMHWKNYDEFADGSKDVILYTSIMQTICKPLFKNYTEFYSTHTTIYVPSPIKISIWIVIFSIVIGLTVLLFIAYILYKLGFYQRKERDQMQLIKENEEKENFYEDFDIDLND